jgi:hypothetical protein
VQGHELPLLHGAERSIREYRPILCLEFEPYVAGAESCRRLLQWLADHEYGGFRLIYANGSSLPSLTQQLARKWAVSELEAELAAKRIGPYATLIAYTLYSPSHSSAHR